MRWPTDDDIPYPKRTLCPREYTSDVEHRAKSVYETRLMGGS